MTTCKNCNAVIDHEALYELTKELVDGVNTGVKEDLTDLEEAMYHGMYCAKCCKQFISEEQ